MALAINRTPKNLFTSKDAWNGGFYELEIELPENSKKSIKEALTHLWAHPNLEGCYLNSNIEPNNQVKVSPSSYDHEGHWYGIATHPNEIKSCCGSFYIDYGEDGCWLTFYLPLGSLSEVYPVGAYPFNTKLEPSPEPWIKEVDRWLVEIARFVYRQIKFNIGVIGFEVDVFDVKKKIVAEIPSKRWEGILLPNDKELIWFPPTIYGPP